jgi:PAS domain S-box-containing protein
MVLLFIFCTSLLSAGEFKKVSLQLQWKYQFEFAGYMMAKEKGFYKDIGLDLTIKEWEIGIDMVDEVISGNSTYAIARSSSLIDISKGKKIIYLAAIFQSNPLIFLADKSSGIRTIKDFKNKKVMTTGDSNTDASLISMMFSQGITLDAINIQKPSFDVKDLMNGKTDLMSSYISNEPFSLKELGGDPVVFSPKDFGFDFYNDIMITSENNLKNEPEEVENFRKATLKGWEYAFDNIEETVNIIYSQYNTQNKSKASLLFEAKELKKLAYFQTNEIGKIEYNKLEKIYNVYKLLGLLNGDVNLHNIIYDSLSLGVKLTSKEIEYLQNKQTINMCIDPNWMPFEQFDENDNYIGMSAEYFKIFAENLSVDFNVIHTNSWTETLEFAKQKKCDILSLAMETPQRKKYLNFTTPYLETPLVVATKLGVHFINDVNDLKGKKIGISKGYAFSELLKYKYPLLNIIDVENTNEGLEKVNHGELFGFVGSLASIGYTLQREYAGELKIAGKFDETWKLGIGVRNDDVMLLNVLQKAVNSLSKNEKREILNNWISIKYEKSIDSDLIWKIIGVVFLILLFFAYKQYMLKQSLNEFTELIDSTLEAIFISQNGRCVNVNQSAVDMFGYSSKEEIIGKHLVDFITNDFKEVVKEKMKLANVEPYELTVQRKDKTKFHAFIRGHTLKNKNLRISSMIDITAIKQLESQSKLASMGEMIGNIAHQWRQPLSIISTAATGMKMQKEYGMLEDEMFFKGCENINENAQYLSQTIEDFRNFISGESKRVRFDLKNDTESFIKLVDSSIRKYNINIILDLEEHIKIQGYPNELIQCFMNIFNNSRDALLDNNIDENDRYVFISQKIEDNNVIIKFKDNAKGIPDKLLEKIFEPYFTTKHKSKGTGLGLNMTYNFIVNSMDGKIEVHNVHYTFNNHEYEGAEFTITLPMN